MSRQIRAALSIVVVLVLAGWGQQAPTQAQSPKVTINKIQVPELDLFDDKGNKNGKLDRTETSNLKSQLPLEVVDKAGNGLLKIRLPDGRQVWINGLHVTPSVPLTEIVPCDPGRGMVVAGATRGSGVHCK